MTYRSHLRIFVLKGDLWIDKGYKRTLADARFIFTGLKYVSKKEKIRCYVCSVNLQLPLSLSDWIENI